MDVFHCFYIACSVFLFNFVFVGAIENVTYPIILQKSTDAQDLSEAPDLLHGNSSSAILADNIQDAGEIDLTERIENGTWSNGNENITETEVGESRNVTALPEVMEDDGMGNSANRPAIGTGESAIILAGTFLVLAAGAYGAMFTWRRYLQVRYGNSEMLITDDVYDISDLRNFEI